MRIMITGGGTGGHTSPAVAIIEELFRRDPRLALQWIGCRRGIERRVCESLGIPFRSLPVEGWPRKSRIRKVWTVLKLAVGTARAFLYLRNFRPQVVLGVGGYVSVPLVWAAQRMGIPTVLHEQNKRLGLANRFLATRAERILLSFPDTIGDYPEEKAMVVGNPVRSGFSTPPTPHEARAALNLDPSIPVVLVTGGSQGAHSLNEAMRETLQGFEVGEVQFIWMTGNADVAAAREAASQSEARVDVHAFIDDMVTAAAAASLMVGRAGASSTAEVAALRKPSILIPYPHATDNHQEQNARAFEEAGAAVLLADEACTGEVLARLIRELIHNEERLADMGRAAETLARPVAVEAIVEEMFSLVFPDAH